MALMIMMKMLQKGSSMPFLSSFLKYTFLSIAGLWAISGIMLRIGEVNNGANTSQIGKTMFSPAFFSYQKGMTNESGALNMFYPYFNKALTRINSEDQSRILRIGTSFSYFIDNNTERIFIDNQLGLFDRLHKNYSGDQNVIAAVLKASGFKYIIVDLNTPYIDQTPEQSLRKKYKELMKFLKGNSNLEMIGTNRIIREKSSKYGKFQNYAKVFQTPDRNSETQYGGQYAFYEIK